MPNSHLLSLGAVCADFRSAPLSLRERLAFPPEARESALREIRRLGLARGAAIVSTCNRTEIFFEGGDPAKILAWAIRHLGLEETAAEGAFRALSGEEAALRAFRIASGLDSMSLGETQILGQMREAAAASREAAAMSPGLGMLFDAAFAAAKRARRESGIGEGTVSLSACAQSFAEEALGSLEGRSALILGAGDMARQVLERLASAGLARLAVANRSVARAREIAAASGAEVLSLLDLPARLSGFDLVVCAASAPSPLICRGMAKAAIGRRGGAPMAFADLSVPRGIDPGAASVEGASLRDVDALGAMAEAARARRAEAAAIAEAICSEEARAFAAKAERLSSVAAIRALRDRAERIRRQETERALKAIARGESPERALEALGRAIANKMLHAPTKALSESPSDRAALSRALGLGG